MINMKSIREINDYININKSKIDSKYRLKFHMMPPVGWMNDPNGLVYHNGKYHIFYQANPFNSLPGTMYWGEFITNDLITYDDMGIAIAPNIEHSSIFSGGAISDNGMVSAIYTVHYEHDGCKRESVYLSEAKDGINFTEYGCVFDNETLPSNISREDFRDPYPVKVNDEYYVLIGAKDIIINKGLIVVLKGKTLRKLTYAFSLGPYYELGDMGECPSYYHIDGKDVILASGCRVAEVNNNYKNENSSVFIVGNIDFVKEEFKLDFIKEIDKGDVFYAPQIINSHDKPIMIGWLEMWGKRYPTHELNHGWNGALSIPRVLSIKNNDIYQYPIEIPNHYYKEFSKDAKSFDMTLEFNSGGELIISSENGNVKIGLENQLYLDTHQANNLNGCIRKTNNSYTKTVVRVLVDTSSVEVFVDGGKEAISSRIFLDGSYELSTNDNVKVLNLKEIGVE